MAAGRHQYMNKYIILYFYGGPWGKAPVSCQNLNKTLNHGVWGLFSLDGAKYWGGAKPYSRPPWPPGSYAYSMMYQTDLTWKVTGIPCLDLGNMWSDGLKLNVHVLRLMSLTVIINLSECEIAVENFNQLPKSLYWISIIKINFQISHSRITTWQK